MKKLLLFFVGLGMSVGVFAQQNFIKHKVEAGETVTKIAQKYQVTPATIIRLNPDVQNGLKPESILLIPKGNGVIIQEKPENETAQKTHLVSAKETIYGLTKLYNISESDLQKANPGLAEEGLKIGSELVIPNQKVIISPEKAVVLVNKNTRTHTVEAKETVYSIAKKYGVETADLELLNPEIKSGLPTGFLLKIPKEKVEIANKEVVKPNAVIIKVPTKPNTVSYEVQPKETLYGIASKSGFSQEELIALNPALKDGVKEGMVVLFPSTSKKNQLEVPKKMGDLMQTLDTSKRRKVVLLLPFNISKIQNDTTSLRNRIRNDKFLNMTLDFYSGALIAIDSAKTLGLNIDVKIVDSQETKNTSNVATLFNQSNFTGTDLVIGPFYQTNVEAAALLLKNDNITIISPLSKETNTALPNVIQTIPSDLFMKNKMFEFMQQSQSTTIGIIDTKKVSTRKYLAENQPNVKLVNFETNETTISGVKSLLQKGKKNYIILDTENTFRIKMIINALLAMQSEYTIQLVILDPNPKLESDEIKIESLAQLNLMYPSLSKQITSNEDAPFIQKYRKLNMVSPNTYAVRGFDLTFDAFLRLSQEIGFKETLGSVSSEHFENKFVYTKNEDKGFKNTGFYILYYDNDLSIKTAN